MLNIDKIQNNIGYQAKSPEWLIKAMTHKSYIKRHPEHMVGNNERLEFIGDAIVDLVVADVLFEKFPEDNEGQLSRKRASLVNEESLYNIAMRLHLDECILVDEGDNGNSQLRYSKRLLAGCFEALIGAVYKDAGFAAANDWVRKIYVEHASYDFANHDFEKDYKTRFQESIQEKFKVTPVYKLLGFTGPDHQKQFHVEVVVNDQVWGEGFGDSKKNAEQDAAAKALKRGFDVV